LSGFFQCLISCQNCCSSSLPIIKYGPKVHRIYRTKSHGVNVAS
jgi:hypothetical protein